MTLVYTSLNTSHACFQIPIRVFLFFCVTKYVYQLAILEFGASLVYFSKGQAFRKRVFFLFSKLAPTHPTPPLCPLPQLSFSLAEYVEREKPYSVGK